MAEDELCARCWNCAWEIDSRDRFCRQCGQGQGAWIPWYYRPLALVLLAFTVLGPFALPLVWRTPYLGRAAKWVASIGLVVVTGYVGWRLTVTLGELGDVLTGL